MSRIVFMVVMISFQNVSSDIGCIPTAGLGVITDPQQFFPRLAKSIDYCIDNFVLVKTESVNLTEGIDNLIHSSHIKNLTIIQREKYFFGVSEGWNTILKAFPNSPWYLVLAYDIELRPHLLELMSRRFWDQSQSHISINSTHNIAENPILLAFSSYENADVSQCAYNIFAFTQQVLQDLGYFDENLFPAFWEDTDWQYRFDRYYGWNNSRSQVYYDIKNWHGIHGSTKHMTGTAYLEKTFPNWPHVRHGGNVGNKNYVRRKWGCNGRVTIDTCAFFTPYGNPSFHMGYWVKDVKRVEGMRASLVPVTNITR